LLHGIVEDQHLGFRVLVKDVWNCIDPVLSHGHMNAITILAEDLQRLIANGLGGVACLRHAEAGGLPFVAAAQRNGRMIGGEEVNEVLHHRRLARASHIQVAYSDDFRLEGKGRFVADVIEVNISIMVNVVTACDVV